MRTRPAALLVSTLALTAACTGSSGKPQVLPSITATPSATAVPVVVPSAARARTPQGAEAFVRFFYAEMNDAFSGSDASIIKALSNDECVTCSTYINALESAAKDGESIQGDSFLVTAVAVPPLQETGTIAEVDGTTPARKVVGSAGQVIEDLKSDGAFHVQVAVKWLAGRWLVSGIRLAK